MILFEQRWQFIWNSHILVVWNFPTILISNKVEIMINTSFLFSIESDTFTNHVLAFWTTNMEGYFKTMDMNWGEFVNGIPNNKNSFFYFASSCPQRMRFMVFVETALKDERKYGVESYFWRVPIFGVVEIVSSCSS